MEKKKRIISKLIFVLVLAAVVSMCFVGTTLARYVSSDSGMATTEVATWKVNITTDGTTSTDGSNISLGMISPAEDAYVAATHATTPRSNIGTRTKVAQISVENDVIADLTITAGAVEASLAADVQFGSDAWTSEKTDGDPTQAQVEGLFTVALYINEDTDNAQSATSYTSGTVKELAIGTHTIYVYAEVKWTSADTTLEEKSDMLDTWVGANVTNIGFDLSYSAVQGSEQPTA